MKILQLCRKFPYPLKDGESIAVTYLAKAYRDLGAEVTLLSFNTIKTFYKMAELPDNFDHYQAIHTVYLDNYPEPIGAFMNLFSKQSYHISRFITKPFQQALSTLLQKNKYDIIQLESVYFAPYISVIRKLSSAKVVMRAHNVEFEIWDRVAQNTTSFIKKWYLTYLVKKLKNYEISQLNNYDLLLAMTEKDLTYFKKLGFRNKSLVTPIGLQLTDYQNFEIKQQTPAISFIGSLDWMPNQEGLVWFLENVWSDLRKKIPSLMLHVAGRNTPDWIFEKAGNGVVIHGEVEDAKAFLKKYPLTIVPLFSGSGMRVKILEGMAMARVVVTTTLGLEGIPAKAGKEVLIANDKTMFINQIIAVFNKKEGTLAIQRNARQFIESKYDYLKIGQKVLIALAALAEE